MRGKQTIRDGGSGSVELADGVLEGCSSRSLVRVIGRITCGVFLDDGGRKSGDSFSVVIIASVRSLDQRRDERLIFSLIQHQRKQSLDSGFICFDFGV